MRLFKSTASQLKAWGVSLVAVTAAAGSASAGIVYQSVPSLYHPTGAVCSSCFVFPDAADYRDQAADPFTPSTWTVITGFDVVDVDQPDWTNAFVRQNPILEVYSAKQFSHSSYTDPNSGLTISPIGAAPLFLQGNPEIFSGGDAPKIVDVFNGFDVVHEDVSGLTLNGGHQYWLSFYADTGNQVAFAPGQNNGGIAWGSFYWDRANKYPESTYLINGNLEYILFGYTSVPEPATWAMLILGVGMIGFAARRRSERVALAA